MDHIGIDVHKQRVDVDRPRGLRGRRHPVALDHRAQCVGSVKMAEALLEQ